ncbi:MAG: hypothetical protein DRI93_00555 [Aquificota bacterium]|uniref:Uncharacterized protein n=1 Tax=Thermosulfidibacter takaii TaxID=412593 RepID=A0A7C0U693_9BACT|nr:MAG: hypothetical protein DRI93_00555 [Aquificota bacterium]HDD52891.1 hypothetical protein [Thermosulfidibacter takaii]
MLDRKLLKETVGLYSELSLIHVVSACKAMLKEGIPEDLSSLMDHIRLLKDMGELLSRTLDTIYAVEDIDEDLGEDWEEGGL